MTLALIEPKRAGKGPELSNFDEVYSYEVTGLPHGEEAWISLFKQLWQILRVRNGLQGEWTGEYESAEAALAALQAEFN